MMRALSLFAVLAVTACNGFFVPPYRAPPRGPADAGASTAEAGLAKADAIASYVDRGAPFVDSATSAPTTTTRPTELKGFIANPGIGWMTMFRPSIYDKTIPKGVTSTLYYYRVDWNDVHVGPGRYDFASTIDRAIADARRGGQQVMLRLMPVWEKASSPKWLRDAGVKGYAFSVYGQSAWVADLDDKRVQGYVAALLAEMGKRYDGHADVDSVEINLLGIYGEGHFSDTKPKVPMPSTATQRWLADQHYKRFTKTPLIGPVSLDEPITDYMFATHGATRGAGIFMDCWGDYDLFGSWSHMKNFYPQAVAKAGKSAAWKRGIIKLEPCSTMASWPGKIKPALDWAVAQHASYIGNKSTTVPGSGVADVTRALDKIGYRFVVRRVDHPSRLRAGRSAAITVALDNIGNAPPYHDYRVAVQIRDDGGRVLSTTRASTTLKFVAPGAHRARVTATAPAASGRYRIAIGVVRPGQAKAAVRLAITGRDAAGWYPVSTVTVD